MKPFSRQDHFRDAYAWLRANADAECTILVDVGWARLSYHWTPCLLTGLLAPGKLYGPIKDVN